MKKWYKICGLLGFFLTFNLLSTAQNTGLKPITNNSATFSFFPKNRLVLATPPVKRQVWNIFPPKNISLRITPSTATQQFGFFCRAELKTDAALKIPVRFRLGSLQYCDYMEGKTRRLPER